MRILAVILTFALTLPASAQVPAQAPTQPTAAAAIPPPASAPEPSSAQPSAGGPVKALSDPILTEPTAPWIGTKAYWKKNFAAADMNVTLQAPVRLRDYVVDGKIELSLKNYLDLVLVNNTDIAISRLSLETPKNAIQRAFSPFDPFINSSFNASRAVTPTSNALEGASILSNLNQPFSLRYQQTLENGTQLISSLAWTKTSTNNAFQTFNPGYSNSWAMGFAQPLLRNRGRYVNRLPIIIARSTLKSTGLRFESTLQAYMVQAENAYWDVVSAKENIKVQEQALDLARQSLERARKEIELGATSPLEIYQPEQQYATAQINLTRIQFLLLQAEDVLRRYIAADLDPDVRKMPIVLTEKVESNLDEKPFDREALVQLALGRRPDLKAEKEDIISADFQIQSARNLLKPLMNLTGTYTTFGRGGTEYLQGGGIIPGSPSDSWGQLVGFSYPTYAMGVTFNFPLRDRNAAANLADTMVNKKMQIFQQRQVEQQIRQDVLTAITQVESSRASVKLAKIAVDYSIKRAEADQKRYDLGVITLFFLLSSQTDLTNAQSNLVASTVQYRRNVVSLQQRLGTILEDKGIVVQ